MKCVTKLVVTCGTKSCMAVWLGPSFYMLFLLLVGPNIHYRNSTWELGLGNSGSLILEFDTCKGQGSQYFEQVRGTYLIQAHLSFHPTRNLYNYMRPGGHFLKVDWTQELAQKILNQSPNKVIWDWINHKHVEGKIFMLDGWEVWSITCDNSMSPRGVHSLLYFAYTCVRDLFIGGLFTL